MARHVVQLYFPFHLDMQCFSDVIKRYYPNPGIFCTEFRVFHFITMILMLVLKKRNFCSKQNVL